MDPAAYFGGCVRVDARGFCAGPLPKATQKNQNLNRIWNSVSWQLGAPTPAYNFGHRPLGETVDLLARIPTAPLVKLVDGAPTNETFVLVFLVERSRHPLCSFGRSSAGEYAPLALPWDCIDARPFVTHRRWLDVITEQPPLKEVMSPSLHYKFSAGRLGNTPGVRQAPCEMIQRNQGL